jgi:hypothetical protein
MIKSSLDIYYNKHLVMVYVTYLSSATTITTTLIDNVEQTNKLQFSVLDRNAR